MRLRAAPETASLRFVGLASSGIGTAPGDLAFAVRLQSGVAEVRELGAYKTETGFAAGDTFSINVEGGVVTYAKNGAVFHTSGSQASYGVRVHAIFFDANATIAAAPAPTPVAQKPRKKAKKKR